MDTDSQGLYKTTEDKKTSYMMTVVLSIFTPNVRFSGMPVTYDQAFLVFVAGMWSRA